jgi:pimeloyl-ACP methyl ester carboxylesterase
MQSPSTARALTLCLLIPAGGVLASTREEFLQLVRPRPAELNPEVVAESKDGEFRRERIRFTSEPGQRVAMLMLRPDDDRPRPAVLVLHGTRGRKEGMLDWLRDLARMGFAAFATDARRHGELADGDYEDAIIAAYRSGKGHPWLYETVTDTIRAIDYLQARPDVLRDRIGMIGISMGGMNTWLTAAADERVKVAIPCIGVTSFGYQIRTGQFAARCATLPRFPAAVARDLGKTDVDREVAERAWSRVLPGILDRFDCPAMLKAIAPRPLLILNGELDERCPLEGVKLCYAAAEAEYRRVEASDRLKMIVAPKTGHQVTPEQRQAALAWCRRWLEPDQ